MYKKLGKYESNYTTDFDEDFEKLRDDLNKSILKIDKLESEMSDIKIKMGDVEIKNIGQTIRIDNLEDILFQTRNNLYSYTGKISRILIFINQFFEKEPYRTAILNAFISFFVVRFFS